MPQTRGYFGCDLDAITTVTAAGLSVHVRDRESAQAVCDVVFTRNELHLLLARMEDVVATQDTARVPAPAPPARQS